MVLQRLNAWTEQMRLLTALYWFAGDGGRTVANHPVRLGDCRKCLHWQEQGIQLLVEIYIPRFTGHQGLELPLY